MTTKEIIAFLQKLNTDNTQAIILALLAAFAYAGFRIYKDKVDNLALGNFLAVALSSFSFLGGYRVILIGLENKLAIGYTEQIYLVLGGVAVMWNSGRAIRTKVIEKPKVS
ncbi:hypothetical protein [Fibrella forsythiae]|uniref:Holin n=1 Tax=Fibrella forsythiae TaxID=2817061 RepID=A0ABS3JB91_9BACT|nr:hypothetical protein [Fibrella forsythiae]MBO0947253.1 hypothetical protein [Fibrella forsythiae]